MSSSHSVPPSPLCELWMRLDRLDAEADLWAVHPEKGFAIVAAGEDAIDAWRAAGLRVERDRRHDAALRRARRATAGAGGGIPGFPCYRTVEETFAAAQAMVAAHPDLATWIDIGDSWEKIHAPPAGYDLRVLRLTQAAIGGDKPALFVNTALHAREYTTAELGTRFAEHLVERYGIDPDVTWILDHHEIHLLLMANPDGRKRAETGLSWRKNANNDFCGDTDDRGVDLNRNFAFQWGCCGGSSTAPCASSFRGPSASSEPEDAAIEAYLRTLFPDQRPDDTTTPAAADATGIMLDVHSFGGDVLWSWGFTTTQPPNGAALYSLGRKYAYFTDYRPQHGSLSTVDGSTKDFAYGALGVAGFTIELGSAFFESCATFESSILPANLDALRYTAKVVRTPYLTPSGPNVLAAAISPQVAEPGRLVTVTATVDDRQFSTANGIEPTQTIAGADAYVDVPPWGAAPAPIALAAADGSFDAKVEEVTGTLDTSGLALGRHLVYLQGRDAAGSRGAVSAAFLWLLDPAVSPTIQGVVRDAVSA